MKPLAQIAHLLSMDVAFRQAFVQDPEKAVAARGLTLDADAQAALAGAPGLLALSPRQLAERISSFTNLSSTWGSFTLDPAAPALRLS